MVQTTEQKVSKTGGDDLDDGLELDPDLLADSDAEAEGSGSEAEEEEDNAVLEEEDDFEPAEIVDEDEPSASNSAGEGKKRKADEVELGDESEEAKKAEKKRRKKEKEKERKAKKRQNGAANSTPNDAPTHFTTSELSAVFLKSLRESYPSASAVELEDKLIPETNLLSPAEYSVPKAVESAEGEASFVSLAKRVETLLKPLKSKKLETGSPRVIILSLSGLRCADVVRGVRDIKGPGEVAKLFAKHFKLADQVKYLEKTKVTIAVGTPARVGKLLEEGAIKITPTTVVLLDISHKDSKTRTILTLPEVRDELWKSIFGGEARATLIGGGARIGAC
ncbi:hypothetical protein CI109_100803 [Kwoniella shandongensis]|uniref:Uncharacterized protein n=1 Tax=Kwoniella shandongensis TaxID=1734106 RepID=A0A5M6BUT6_9TREE|nr:uncharacterized protein CI109_005018 [Kwoniella shandongensis]KAA5526628.1 hypothetical protein CI109_005018 [Kwoniella shandongensis]